MSSPEAAVHIMYVLYSSIDYITVVFLVKNVTF